MYMDDSDKTVCPRKKHCQTAADLTLPGRRDRKNDGNFVVGDTILNRYKVLAFLGRGGMGVVYKCFDETGGVEIALKALPPELSHDRIEMESIRENFQLVHNLHHPNIANLNQLTQDPENGAYYLIMEYIQGVTLTDYIKNSDCTAEQKKHIMLEIAQTLDFVHRQKLIHRDIKPENIMITTDGSVKILDFGIASKLENRRSGITEDDYCGSIPYMAPELLFKDNSSGISPAVDLYALAVIVFEWIYGCHPYGNGTSEELKKNIAGGNISFPLKAKIHEKTVFKKALSRIPDERYPSCEKFIKDFFASYFHIPYKIILFTISVLLVCLGILYFISCKEGVPGQPTPPPLIKKTSPSPIKDSPRLLIKCQENIRNLKTETLSQGLLQEIALSYGFQPVKHEGSCDFVIDVRFTGAYKQKTFSFNKNLKLHSFSLGADMCATYPDGSLISQVTLPSKDFIAGKIEDPQEALRDCIHRRINSREEKSFHDILLQVLEKWCNGIEKGISITVSLKDSEDIVNDISNDVLSVMKKKKLLSDYNIHPQDGQGYVTIEVISRMQSMELANLFVILSRKRLQINSVEYGKITLERKKNDS